MEVALLADRLYRASAGALGSGEHLQVAGLLGEARRTVIDREGAAEVRSLLDRDPWAFESNLDAIACPSSPEWYEWPLETRSGHGGGEAAVTGCLVAPHPEAHGLCVIVTGWDDGSGLARHAYAVALVDLAHLYELAFAARTRFSRTPDESLERMMACVSAYLPGGFGDEVDIISDGSPLAREATLRDATAEVPFLLALMVAMRSKGGFDRKDGGGATHATLSARVRPGFAAAAASWLSRRPVPAFSRRVRNGAVELSWNRGAARA